MLTLRAIAFVLLALTPVFAHADAKPPAAPALDAIRDARLVPTVRDRVLVGYKVFAIKAGGRFDQAQDPFKAGDLIEVADGHPATSTEGQVAIAAIATGASDVVVEVRRQGALVKLTSKAVH